MKYPNFAKSVTVAGEQPPITVGWDKRIYQVQPGNFLFSKKTLNLSQDMFIEQFDLGEGSIRVDGEIHKDSLQISILECEKLRLMGIGIASKTSTLSYNGSFLDFITTAPASGVTFNAGSKVTQKIIPENIRGHLINNMRRGEALSSLVLPLNENVNKLSKITKQMFRLVNFINTDQIDEVQFQWMEQELIETAATIVDELIETEYTHPKTRFNTYAIARKIEDILWLNPTDNDVDLDVEYFRKYFNCSRRQVQFAIQEHFGMGFVAFKRVIRLHQVNETIRVKHKNKSITDIAYEHYFQHTGRFAGYYKRMFGVNASYAKEMFQLEN